MYILIENLEQKSLKGQRMVYDHIRSIGEKPHDFPIRNELIISCKGASSKYKADLEQSNSTKAEDLKSKKRKLIQEEISEVKRKKLTTEACLKFLQEDADRFSLEAEEKNEMQLLINANSFRKLPKGKN